MKDLYMATDDSQIPNLIRTVRDDITLKDMHASILINNNINNMKSRSFKVNINKNIEWDNINMTSEYIESFIDAMVRVYGNNVEKINGYSFKISCALGKNALLDQVCILMRYCRNMAMECGISSNKVAFREATAITDMNSSPCVSVTVYMAPFPISSHDNVQISKWNTFRLFMKEVYRILVSK